MVSSQSPIYLSAIAHAIGRLRPISEIERLVRDEARMVVLSHHGLRDYSEAPEGPASLAIESARGTLTEAQLSPGDIDLVLYASTSFERREHYTTGFAQFASALGLGEVTPVGTFLSECANLVSALRLGAGLLRAGDARRILLVCTDTFPDDEARLRNQFTVNSDGAASCLLTTEARPGFELLGLHQVTDQRARSPEDAPTRYMRVLEGVRRAAAGLREKLGATRHIDGLVVNNYHRQCVGMIARKCDFVMEQVFTDNIPRHAHLSSADGLINLRDRAAKDDQPENLMCLTTGLATWASFAVRVVR